MTIAHYNCSAKNKTHIFHLLHFILLLLMISWTSGSESPGRVVKTQTTPSSNQGKLKGGFNIFRETTETQHTEQENSKSSHSLLFTFYIPGDHSHPIGSTGVDWHFDIDTTWKRNKKSTSSNLFKELTYLFKFRNIYFSTCIFICKFLNRWDFKELSKDEISL